MKYIKKSAEQKSLVVEKRRLEHSPTFRVIPSNQKQARALTSTPTAFDEFPIYFIQSKASTSAHEYCDSIRRVSDLFHPIKSKHERSRVLRQQSTNSSCCLATNFRANIAGSVNSRKRDFSINYQSPPPPPPTEK